MRKLLYIVLWVFLLPSLAGAQKTCNSICRKKNNHSVVGFRSEDRAWKSSPMPSILNDNVPDEALVFVDGIRVTRADLDQLEPTTDSVYYRIYGKKDQKRLKVHFSESGVAVFFCTTLEERERLEIDESTYIRAALMKPITIKGIVVDDQNKPIEGVVVNVMQPHIQSILSVKTDSSGCFQYMVMGQAVGTFLFIDHNGYEYQHKQIMEESQDLIRIVLRPIVQPCPSNLPSPLPAPALEFDDGHPSNSPQ